MNETINRNAKKSRIRNSNKMKKNNIHALINTNKISNKSINPLFIPKYYGICLHSDTYFMKDNMKLSKS